MKIKAIISVHAPDCAFARGGTCNCIPEYEFVPFDELEAYFEARERERGLGREAARTAAREAANVVRRAAAEAQKKAGGK